MNVCFVLSLFFCLPFLCIVWLQIHCGSTIASGTSRSPHYCAPLLSVFNLQRKLLVWQLNQPKPILLLMEPRNRKNFSAQIGSSLTAPLDSIFKQSSLRSVPDIIVILYLGVLAPYSLRHVNKKKKQKENDIFIYTSGTSYYNDMRIRLKRQRPLCSNQGLISCSCPVYTCSANSYTYIETRLHTAIFFTRSLVEESQPISCHVYCIYMLFYLSHPVCVSSKSLSFW